MVIKEIFPSMNRFADKYVPNEQKFFALMCLDALSFKYCIYYPFATGK